MKNLLLFVMLILAVNFGFAQTYFSFIPSLTNSAGTLGEKSNFSFEVGRQWDVFSLGADIGKTSLGKVVGKDTSVYLEVRPNLNIFQAGKFTNTLTPGIGFIFNSKENLVTELTSGIEYAYSTHMHFNIIFGTYYYSGRTSASNVTFFGVSLAYYFKAYNTTSLLQANNLSKPASK